MSPCVCSPGGLSQRICGECVLLLHIYHTHRNPVIYSTGYIVIHVSQLNHRCNDTVRFCISYDFTCGSAL